MEKMKPSKKCAYFEFCYIAEATDCFGYRTDCALYMVTNDEKVSEVHFHRAMNNLIDKTKLKHAEMNKK